MKFKLLSIIGITFFIFFGIFTQKAYAYLDPGTGSYIFQLFIAGVIGGLFAVKLFWAKIVLFFKRVFTKKQKQ